MTLLFIEVSTFGPRAYFGSLIGSCTRITYIRATDGLIVRRPRAWRIRPNITRERFGSTKNNKRFCTGRFRSDANYWPNPPLSSWSAYTLRRYTISGHRFTIKYSRFRDWRHKTLCSLRRHRTKKTTRKRRRFRRSRRRSHAATVLERSESR